MCEVCMCLILLLLLLISLLQKGGKQCIISEYNKLHSLETYNNAKSFKVYLLDKSQRFTKRTYFIGEYINGKTINVRKHDDDLWKHRPYLFQDCPMKLENFSFGCKI